MSLLLTFPVALPLAAAAAAILLRGRVAVQRTVSLATSITVLAIGITLVAATADGTVLAHQVGGWAIGIAIPLAADAFSALLITVAALMTVCCTWFAIARGEDDHELFHPLVMVLVTGVFGSFLTADLFNLFVFFEVMLIASYVLLTLAGGAAQVRAGAIYVSVNLLASTVFLIGVGLLYGTVGTVNFAGLHGVAQGSAAATLGAGVVAVAIAVKASVVPLHGWLPRSYTQASPAVTALFSGLLTKAGVYVLYRLYQIVFDGDPAYTVLILVVAAVTMVVGVLGAVGQGNMRGILAFHMVSQMGYLVLPLGLWGSAGLAAGIFYLVQYIAVKGSLFLSAGAVETVTGTGTLKKLGGLVRTRPVLATAFLLSALALAGLPPTSGFVGKFLLIRAAFEGGQFWAGAIAVAVSFFTLLSMVKIWNGVFWGEPATVAKPATAAVGIPVPAGGSTDHPSPAVWPSKRRAAALIAAPVFLALLTLATGIGAEGLLTLAQGAAESLLDPSAYLEAVGSQ